MRSVPAFPCYERWTLKSKACTCPEVAQVLRGWFLACQEFTQVPDEGALAYLAELGCCSRWDCVCGTLDGLIIYHP
jgi:hypothetical protein